MKHFSGCRTFFLKRRIIFSLFLFLVTTVACNPEEDDKTDRLQYFDIKNYMSGEIERLQSAAAPVTKKVFLNGQTEEQQITVANWENELKAFTEADINKQAFLGNYDVDSSDVTGNVSVIYSARNDDLAVKELVVQYDSLQMPAKINILVATRNTLYTSQQLLVYEPDSGYSISGKQNVRFFKADTFAVSTVF